MAKKSKSKTKHVEDEEQQVKARKEAADEEAVDVDVDAEEEKTEVDDGDATEVDTDDDDVKKAKDADESADADAEPPDDEDDDAESVDEGPKYPPAKLTRLAYFLIIMNWLVAQGFLVLLFVDLKARTDVAYRTKLNLIQVIGLPLKSDENTSDVSNESRPLIAATPEQLKAAFKSRGGKSMPEQFAPFEETVDKRVPFRLRPSDLSDDPQLFGVVSLTKNPMLVEVFQGLPDPVPTLDHEIERLKGKLDGDIAEAAKEAIESLAKKKDDEKRGIVKKRLAPFSWDTAEAKKIEAAIDASAGADLDALMKRAVIRNVLYPIAWNVWQIKKLDEKVEATKDAKQLDALLEEALVRRMYYDILAPINIFRPGDLNDYKIDNLADWNAYKLDEVKEFMQGRLSAAIADTHQADHHLGKHWTDAAQDPKANQRDAIEKRHKIAFIMFALSEVNVPVVDRKLYAKGVERAQVVSGLFEFSNATIYYARAREILYDRFMAATRANRDGYLVEIKGKAGELTYTDGFSRKYEEEIDKLVRMRADVDAAQKRLDDLNKQKKHYVELQKQRADQHNDILMKLIDARKRTEAFVKDLRKKQDELHDALQRLSEANEVNQRLFDEIRAIEFRYIQEEEAIRKKMKGKRP